MPRRRLALILISVVSALVFIVARVLYRVVFGGAGGGATALPSLSPIRLGGPFSHIVLFGPLTLEGLVLAAVSALPFASVIVVLGIAVAWWDPRNLISVAPRLRVGSDLVLAVGIAVSTFPVVVHSAIAARHASALRGLKPGTRVFVSVLETTLERALGLARALESRGIRSQSTTTTRTTGETALSFREFSVTGRVDTPVSWTLQPGSLALLTGATGSGKSTLFDALSGVVSMRGDARLVGLCDLGVGASDLAYLPHDPHTLFVASRVLDDIALGLIARGHRPSQARQRAQGALEEQGLADYATREPHGLSSGEAVRVALVMLLATTPKLLLLDEPLSALDAHQRELFLSVLGDYSAQTGATVLMSDHPRSSSTPAGFECFQLGEGGITPGRYVPRTLPTTRIPCALAEADRVATIQGLTRTLGTTTVLDGVGFSVHRGETLMITGANGAGKSTLLQALVDSLPGEVVVGTAAVEGFAPHRRSGLIALVPSDPGTLFVRSSVAEEVALADSCAGVPPGLTALTCESLIPGFLADHATTHPRDLSRGQQAVLAIAVQMSHKPQVLLLDEPTRGLDEAAERACAEVIACVVETGTAVVIAAHSRDALALPSARTLQLVRGQLQAHSEQVSL